MEKQLVSLGTVIATPPILIIGIRGYSIDPRGRHAEFDLHADNLPKYISRFIKEKENSLNDSEKSLKGIKEIYAIIAVTPRNAGFITEKTLYF